MQKTVCDKPNPMKSLAYGVLAAFGAITVTVIVFALLGAMVR